MDRHRGRRGRHRDERNGESSSEESSDGEHERHDDHDYDGRRSPSYSDRGRNDYSSDSDRSDDEHFSDGSENDDYHDHRNDGSRDNSPRRADDYYDRRGRSESPGREYTPERDESPEYRDRYNYDVTIEEAQRDEIRNLKRKLEESRKETRLRDIDNEELKRGKRRYNSEIRHLEDELYQKNLDIADLKHKHKKAEDAQRDLYEDNDDLTGVAHHYYSARETEIKKRKKIEHDLEKEKKKNRDLNARIKEIENGEKYFEAVEKERQRADNYRKMMLSMMQQLENDNKEKNGGTPPRWKTCEICALEYSDSGDKTPRFLSCGHTVCSSCIEKLATNNEIRCPFDRTYTSLENSDITKLPKNYSVLHM
uniref:RING-type domain-containing protein n=1 Tax=Caenorhabditis tropicalis TaxID=1561998 RepID=A0A1I7T144_9PELO